jgi:hypothetical protein
MQRRHWATETTTITQAQPITISVVYIRGTGNTDLVFNGLEVVAQSGNFRLIAGGSAADATAADGSWHAAQGVFNGASSAGYVDGLATTGLNPGTGGASSNTICLGCVIVAGSFDGFIAETGLWPSAFNATQAGNLNTNQHGSNGYDF